MTPRKIPAKKPPRKKKKLKNLPAKGTAVKLSGEKKTVKARVISHSREGKPVVRIKRSH